MRLPDFLVIGAMKCGTTSLYNDLLTNPEIFIPDKELNFLSCDMSRGLRAREEYAAKFRRATNTQCLGDVSTEYSMLPEIADVAQRARNLLPPTTRILYLVREPVARAISHHFHMHCWHGEGRMEADINACVRRYDSIVDYGRYAMQLQPWVEAFGEAAIRVIVFEEYIRDRAATISSLCKLLGVTPRPEQVESDVVYNRGDGKSVLNGFWSWVNESALYRKLIRPTIPPEIKQRLSKILLPKAPPRPAPPSAATVDYIIEQVHDDSELLRKYLGRDEPIWDFEEVRTRLVSAPAARAA